MSSLGVKDVDFGEHGVIYITSDKDRPLWTEWTKPATAELLRVLTKQFELYSNGKLPSKRRLYENCAAHLQKKGFNYTSAQSENKWKSLKRRYLTTYERLVTGRPSRVARKRRGLFDDEIEEVLKIERPSFKRGLDEISQIDLNIPAGFKQRIKNDEDLDEYEGEEFEEYEPEEHEYTQSDEKLVEMVLKDSSHSADEDGLKGNKGFSNIEYLLPNHDEDEAAEYSAEEKYIPHHALGTETLVREMKELKKVVKRSLEVNSDVLKSHNATHEQLLICLDTIDKREEEKMEIKKRKLETQQDLVQQIKIQNSLIAKLIQKLGNNTSSNNR